MTTQYTARMLTTDLRFKQMLNHFKVRSREFAVDSMFFEDNNKINGEIKLSKNFETEDSIDVDLTTAETLSDLDVYI